MEGEMLVSVGQGPHNLKFPKTLQWGWEEVEAGLALKPKVGIAEKAAVSSSHSVPHPSQPVEISSPSLSEPPDPSETLFLSETADPSERPWLSGTPDPKERSCLSKTNNKS